MRLGWWLRDGPLFLVPPDAAVAVYRWAGAFSTLHGVVFAILGPGSAVQRPPRPGHQTVNASRLATRRFNSKPSCARIASRLDAAPGDIPLRTRARWTAASATSRLRA